MRNDRSDRGWLEALIIEDEPDRFNAIATRFAVVALIIVMGGCGAVYFVRTFG